jgi:hypothetical protein
MNGNGAEVSTKPDDRSIDTESAILDPAACFASPEEVRDHKALTTAAKLEILRNWAYDDAEAAVATEEGMPATDGGDLHRRILAALRGLGHEADMERTAPTKQHGTS